MFYSRHSLSRYPEISQQAYKEFLGCFEKPREDMSPTNQLDFPEILPLKYSEEMPNREAMRDPSPLTHPDSLSKRRFVLGTGLQMRPGMKSHKFNTCLYHDPQLSKQGKYIRTMVQEALQVKFIQ